MAMKITGRCHCGRISFEAEVDPTQVRICHCTDCQTLTGTAFRTTVPSLPGTFVLRNGTPKVYIKIAESGNRRAHGFCPECQPHVLWTARGYPRPPRRTAPRTAGLVPFGPSVVDGPHRRGALRPSPIASRETGNQRSPDG